MSTILDVSGARRRLVPMSVEDYELLANRGRLPEHAELIRGFVFEKMPKSPLHRRLTKRLYDLLGKVPPPGFVVFQEAPLRLADSEPEPDVMIVRGEEPDFDTRHPTTASLVIEVAVSNPDFDRANADLYAEGGVEEYWIVLGMERKVEVYRRPLNGVYTARQTIGPGESVACDAVPNLTVALSELFPD